MADELNGFTHIGVKKTTQRKVSILAKVLDDTDMYSLVEYWANSEWENARAAGLVTDAMLSTGKAKNSPRKSANALYGELAVKRLKIAHSKSGGRLVEEKSTVQA